MGAEGRQLRRVRLPLSFRGAELMPFFQSRRAIRKCSGIDYIKYESKMNELTFHSDHYRNTCDTG